MLVSTVQQSESAVCIDAHRCICCLSKSFFSSRSPQSREFPMPYNRFLLVIYFIHSISSFPGGSDGKECACSAGDLGSIPGLGRSPGEGNEYPLQYHCLEIPVTEEPGGLQSMGSQSDAPEQLTLWLFFFPLSSSIVGMCPSQSVRSPSPLFPLGVHALIPRTGLTLRALTGRSREGSVIGERSTLRRCSISGLNSVSEGGSCSFPLVNRRAG